MWYLLLSLHYKYQDNKSCIASSVNTLTPLQPSRAIDRVGAEVQTFSITASYLLILTHLLLNR